MAVAVSAAVMIPVGAQADVTVYGRINNAIAFEDKGGKNDSTTDVSGVSSRFGVKASSDLGNGLTAHGHYEFATSTDKAGAGITSTRIATAGISGGFGRVDVGNQWSAFYNAAGLELDPTYAVGGVTGGHKKDDDETAYPTPFRTANTIKYSNSVGPLTLEADLRLDGGADEGGDGGGIGLRVNATDNVTFAVSYDTNDKSDMVSETAAVYGTRYTFDSGDVDFFELDFEEVEGTGTADTWESGEVITDLVRVGDTGDVYCLSDDMVSEKMAKIRKHNADEKPDTAIVMPEAATTNGGACMVSAASKMMGAETDRLAVSAKVSMGAFWGSLAWSSEEVTAKKDDRETDYTQLFMGAAMSDSTSAMIGYGTSETDGKTAEPSAMTLGLYHNMGGGLRLWYEGISKDMDDGSDKMTRHLVGIRYDF